MPPIATPPWPEPPEPSPGVRDPWFSGRPLLALVVIGILYVAVFTVRVFLGTPVDAFSMLYVLPVALAASAFGRAAGIAAGLVALALILAWTVIRDVALSPAGWASRAIPLLLLGYLLGSAMDRVRRAEAERRRVEVVALLHREAIEINDALIQRITAAKWALEAGRTESTEEILAEAMTEAQRLVSSLITRADMGPGRP